MPTGVVFFAVLSVLVLVHELGHFLAARFLGIKVEEFAFGLPFTKAIFKFKRGETQYSIYPLLFGGFVKLYGEESQAEDKKRSFWNRGRKQRMIVIAAGVIMNLVLAMAAFVGLYAYVGVPIRVDERVTLSKDKNGMVIDPGSPAEKADLRENDQILEVEGKVIESEKEASSLIKSWAGVGVNLKIRRVEPVYLFEGIWEKQAREFVVTVVPRENPPEGQGALGVRLSLYPYLITEKCVMSDVSCHFGAVTAGFKSTGVWVGKVFDGLRAIGKSLAAGQKPEGVSGPVGIYELTDVVAQGGFWPVLELVAILSVNLAVFNILPIPALDGGRMLFIWIEWVRRKRMDAKLEQKINSWGMAFLIGLLILITLQDVIRVGK
ncbi:MAG: membrane-associated zinc metalloprotease [Microgenomates group bacterium Gr01-1014_16]|nr:MAG: membrane-associated zinc metalloprotease [Microgenomates group bacterium Gr01-1014_16]